jgi:Protein of unknown function (DUF3078)
MSRRSTALILLAALALAPAARADAPKPIEPGPWKFGALASFNLAQSSFSTNWKGGDRGSIVWVLGADLSAERQFGPRYNLQNTLRAAYGQTTRQNPDAADPHHYVWDSPDKTTDVLAFESNSRWTLHSFVDPYFSFSAETQFADQSSPVGTIRFNPIKFKETAGAARVLRKTDDSELLSRLGFGFRQTLARAWVDPTLRTQRSFTTQDGGFEWQTTATQPILERKVLYKGRLLVFQPVFYSESSDLEVMDRQAVAYAATTLGLTRESVKDFWRATDVDFQNQFTAQITKLVAVNLFAEFAYDKFDAAANVDPTLAPAAAITELDRNTRKAGQFKQTLALALTYRLF